MNLIIGADIIMNISRNYPMIMTLKISRKNILLFSLDLMAFAREHVRVVKPIINIFKIFLNKKKNLILRSWCRVQHGDT